MNADNIKSNFTVIEQNWFEGRYSLTPLQIKPLTPEWVMSELSATVRLEGMDMAAKYILAGVSDPRRMLHTKKIQHINHQFNHLPVQYRLPAKGVHTIVEKIWSVLLNKNFRRGSAEDLSRYKTTFIDQIEHFVSQELPITAVLPTLPFKSQGLLTTGRQLAEIDLGEWLLFAQLRDLCRSIEAVYPPGMKMYLLSDGLAYGHIFTDGTPDKIAAIKTYREQCREIRESLGLRNAVEIIDMSWIIKHVPELWDCQQLMAKWLGDTLKFETHIHMNTLARALRWHMPNLSGWNWRWAVGLVDLPAAHQLEERTRAIAIGYSSFLLAMKHLDIVKRAFPHAIRMTVHKKDAPQYPIKLINSDSAVAPYNGVPVVSMDKINRVKNIRQAVKVVRLASVVHTLQVAVYDKTNSYPLYYVATKR